MVGDQSSGKSFVLEAITGISFPRGQGTVTRCPLILQSRKAKNGKEYAVVRIESKDPIDKNKIMNDDNDKNSITVSLNDLASTIMNAQDKLTK